jgi:hypothetical protein
MITDVAKMQEQLEALKAENALMKAKAAAKVRPLSCKVSEKGALSVYGLGRFPVTLYKTQWERLFAFVDTLKAFIAENETSFKTKE